MLAKKAIKVFTATDGMEQFFPKDKIIISGNPVRKAIINTDTDHETCLNHFGLKSGIKTVLCVGGSLGAKSINEAIEKDIKLFEENNLQLIWQTGKPFIGKARAICENYKNVYVSDFITQMEYAYTAADVVISRSGAMSVSELCIVAKPVVFVPYPHAAENHQAANAEKLVSKNAALMITDSAALDHLVEAVIELSKNEKKQQELKEIAF
jgi:UDP-N-acetylglucosamine--N-acetylmuramyl-(pentapeptide) pyrophosphoryl-undecaprenol N-acetylglucosamine transferase